MASLNYCWWTLLVASSLSLVFGVEQEEPLVIKQVHERIDRLQQKVNELSKQLKDNQDKLSTVISMINDLSKKIEENPDKTSKNLPFVKLEKSCREVDSSSNGLYAISGIDGLEPFPVWCQMESYEGGWLVIQRRTNGSVDFYRNWTEYRNGFGDVAGEFWLGLERIHQLTKEGTWQLLVEMADFKDARSFAYYSEFSVGSETEGYPLVKLGNYSGTAGDHLKYHQGMKFSTLDRDNDVNQGHCAQAHHGAWWYKNCRQSNLNGQYSVNHEYKALKWNSASSSILKYTMMMIKPVNYV